jgi:hypothetical protein
MFFLVEWQLVIIVIVTIIIIDLYIFLHLHLRSGINGSVALGELENQELQV